jgi:hypothetical protein
MGEAAPFNSVEMSAARSQSCFTSAAGIRVLAFVDRPLHRGLDLVRRIEVRLADTEVDRVGHFGGEVEDFPDSGRVDPAHPFGNPAFAHGGKYPSMRDVKRPDKPARAQYCTRRRPPSERRAESEICIRVQTD